MDGRVWWVRRKKEGGNSTRSGDLWGPALTTAMARWLECRLDALDKLVVDDVWGRCVWAQGLLAITVVHGAS